jgi:hypothetical protein
MPLFFATMGIFYLVSFSLNEAVIRKLLVANLAIYALAGAICPSVLVTLFQLLTTGKGNYILLAVIAPGGLAGGTLLGALGHRARRPSSAS